MSKIVAFDAKGYSDGAVCKDGRYVVCRAKETDSKMIRVAFIMAHEIYIWYLSKYEMRDAAFSADINVEVNGYQKTNARVNGLLTLVMDVDDCEDVSWCASVFAYVIMPMRAISLHPRRDM